jgi:stress response protein YsnF/carbon monoxide dehydrogenase subunit G
MARVEKSIEVDVPVNTAYNQWTQFEQFPQFMEGIEQVTQLDDKHLHWRADIGGKEKEWDAEIVDQIPDQRVAWRSLSGTPNDGVVTFEPVDNNRTRVNLALDYEPEGFLESVGSALGFVSHRVDGDLERFKEFIESRGGETGAWRGAIQGGQETTAAQGIVGGGANATPIGGTEASEYTSTRETSGSGYDTTAGTTSDYTTTGETSRAGYDTTAGTTSDYTTTGETSRAGYTTGTRGTDLDQGGQMSVPIVEEQVNVGKREVEGGGVRVTTGVEERPVEEQVNLRDETVRVDRRPVDRPASDADFGAVREGSFEVRERNEQPVVEKQARVVEEVVVNKEAQDRTETIRDTARRTDVNVEQTPGETRSTGYRETDQGDVTGRRTDVDSDLDRGQI